MASPITLKTVEQANPISLDVTSELLINCFQYKRPQNQVTQQAFYGAHGYVEFGSSAGVDSIRASASNAAGTIGYIVDGDDFYTVDTGGVRTLRGTLDTSTGRCYIAVGSFHAFIVDGTFGYYYTFATTTLTKITDPQFPSSPTQAYYSDGYFITLGTVSGYVTVCLSDLDDPANWSIVNQDAVAIADAPKGLAVFNRQLYVMGNNTTQIMTNTGVSGSFPYSLTTFQQYGLAATASVVFLGGMMYCVGKTSNCKAVLLKGDGSVFQEVNTDLNATLQNFASVSDIYAIAFEDMQTKFIAITAPSENVTYVYMPDTGDMFKWEITGNNRHIFFTYMFLNNKHIIGSRSNSKLYQLSLTVQTEGDGVTPCIRTIISPTAFSDYKWIRASMIRVIMDTSTYASPQTLQMSVSRDGGNTYATALTSSPMSSTSNYCQFPTISAGHRITLKFVWSVAVEFVLVTAVIYARAEGR